MYDMGRNAKMSLDYFPMDIDFFQDLKIRKLIKRQGGKAVAVYACLLCYIYKNGYFMQWDDELPFCVSESTGLEEVYISEVIKSCVTLGLFDKSTYDTYQVLTSRGIQERYMKICRSTKRVGAVKEYNLINPIIDSEPVVVVSAAPAKKKEAEAKTDETPVVSTAAAQPNEPSDNYASEMKANKTWCNVVCMQLDIPPEDIEREIDDFNLHCQVESKMHKDIYDAMRHFVSWQRIKIKANKKTNTDESNRQGCQTRRRANILNADEEKDYSTGF